MRRWTHVIGAAASLALVGCNSISQYHVPPRLPIRPGMSPVDTVGDPNDKDLKQPTIVSAFLKANKESFDHPGDALRAREMTRIGMTLIERRCDLFFESIGRGAQKTDFIRREVQAITTALIGALGIAGAGADTITGVGLASGLGVATIDNYSSVFFFSPEVSAVRALVARAFAALRTELLAPQRSPQTFDEAIQALGTFQNVCTAHEIKSLVTASVNRGVPIAEFGKGQQVLLNAVTEQRLQVLVTALRDLGVANVPTLSIREAVFIDWLLKGPTSADEQLYICFSLPAPLRERMCENASTEPRRKRDLDDIDDKLRVPLETLRALVPGAMEDELQAQKKAAPLGAENIRKIIAEAKAANASAANITEQAAQGAAETSRTVSPTVNDTPPVTGVDVAGPPATTGGTAPPN